MSGTCKILWDDRELPGAQRTLEFVTEKWVHVRKALPFLPPGKVRWSVYNPQATSTYSDGVGKVRAKITVWVLNAFHSFCKGIKERVSRHALLEASAIKQGIASEGHQMV